MRLSPLPSHNLLELIATVLNAVRYDRFSKRLRESDRESLSSWSSSLTANWHTTHIEVASCLIQIENERVENLTEHDVLLSTLF